MREIKFRAWDKKTKAMVGDMVSGSGTSRKDFPKTLVTEMSYENDPFLQVQFRTITEGVKDGREYLEIEYVSYDRILHSERFVPMQYAGFKDKNGKEIYEGDIVDNDGDLFMVVYMDARFMGESEDGLLDFPTKNWLVVGNLYENPNLLSQDK